MSKKTHIAILAPLLPKSLLSRALEVARRKGDEYDHACSLAVLAPYVSEIDRPGVLAEALVEAIKVEEVNRHYPLLDIARCATQESFAGVIHAAGTCTRDYALWIIGLLVEPMARAYGDNAIEEIYKSAAEVIRWWP